MSSFSYIISDKFEDDIFFIFFFSIKLGKIKLNVISMPLYEIIGIDRKVNPCSQF